MRGRAFNAAAGPAAHHSTESRGATPATACTAANPPATMTTAGQQRIDKSAVLAAERAIAAAAAKGMRLNQFQAMCARAATGLLLFEDGPGQLIASYGEFKPASQTDWEQWAMAVLNSLFELAQPEIG